MEISLRMVLSSMGSVTVVRRFTATCCTPRRMPLYTYEDNRAGQGLRVGEPALVCTFQVVSLSILPAELAWRKTASAADALRADQAVLAASASRDNHKS